MHIVIIDQCSGAKATPPGVEPLTWEDIKHRSVEDIRQAEEMPVIPARDLYEGRQQQYITDAVDQLRASGDTVDRVFVSAGFGLIDEATKLPPYDVTFQDCSTTEIETRAETFGIQDAVIQLIQRTDPDLVFFALGSDYLTALDVPAALEEIPRSTYIVMFNHELSKEQENTVTIPARNEEAKEIGTIVVALKGAYIKRFASHRSAGAIVDGLDDLITYCTTELTTQTGLNEYEST